MIHHTHPLSDCRVLVFDLDGTLIDSKQDLVVSVNAVRAHFGHSDLDAEKVSEYVGDGAAMLVRRALGETATERDVEAALRFFIQHYRAHMLAHTVAVSWGARDARGAGAPADGGAYQQAGPDQPRHHSRTRSLPFLCLHLRRGQL
jgi:phosphoglycolate phosphatase-like HAD superfamily hydrolase